MEKVPDLLLPLENIKEDFKQVKVTLFKFKT